MERRHKDDGGGVFALAETRVRRPPLAHWHRKVRQLTGGKQLAVVAAAHSTARALAQPRQATGPAACSLRAGVPRCVVAESTVS